MPVDQKKTFRGKAVRGKDMRSEYHVGGVFEVKEEKFSVDPTEFK
jgi:hypothetical protein